MLFSIGATGIPKVHYSAISLLKSVFVRRSELYPGPLRWGERGGQFSQAPRRLGALPPLENTEKCASDGFFLMTNIHEIHFRPGQSPGPGGEAYNAPQTPSWMVRGHLDPFLSRPLWHLDLRAYGMML